MDHVRERGECHAMLPGVTSADPGDRGEPDRILAAALESGDTASALSRVLLARLLLPVVAIGEPADGGHEKQAEMSVPALIDGSGARALPAFTGLEPLRRWRSEARPVPMPGARLIAGAHAEGYDAVVVDVAGPYPLQLSGSVLNRLAAAAEQLLAGHGTPTVAVITEPDGNGDRC